MITLWPQTKDSMNKEKYVFALSVSIINEDKLRRIIDKYYHTISIIPHQRSYPN